MRQPGEPAERTLVARPDAAFLYPRWSPDGRTIAVMSRLSGSTEIWIHSLDAGTFTQLTQLAREDATLFAEWAPDGQHILYAAEHGLETGPRATPLPVAG